MKRICWLFGVVIFLTGCSGQNRELNEAMQFREKLLAAQGCSFQAEITADYGKELQVFCMDCESDSAGNLRFQIIEPETISGICGEISDSGGALTFDETALCFDLLTDDQLSPVSAPWIFLKTLRAGYITAVCREEELLRITADDSYAENALTLDVWIDASAGPVRADVFWDSRRILSLKIGSFEMV